MKQMILGSSHSGQAEIWTVNEFTQDLWHHDESPDHYGSGIILSFQAVIARKGELPTRLNERLGVFILPEEDLRPLVPVLPSLDVVVLDFPQFSDGRNYSKAKLLRERYNYTGRLRARGDVLYDQLDAMLRCGFDEFEITDVPTRHRLRNRQKPVSKSFPQFQACTQSARYSWRAGTNG